MAIPMRQIPNNLLVPDIYQEIDNSLAGNVGELKKVLIIGTMSLTGSATAGKLVQVVSASKAKALFGLGSPASLMASAFLAKNKTEALFVLPVAEPQAGTAWSKTFTVSAPTNSGAGSITVKINEQEILVAIKEGDTPAEIATSLVAGINSVDNCPITASIDSLKTANLIVSSVVKGINGNANTVYMMVDATGLTITEEAISAGTGDVDMKDLIACFDNVRYNYLITEYTSTENLLDLGNELTDRYSGTRQIGGRCFVPIAGSIGSASENGSVLNQVTRINNPHLVLIPSLTSPELPCVWAASWCAVACRILADDPSANTYDTPITDVTGIKLDFDTRQKLLENGVCTYKMDASGLVIIERLVTSYTENSDGDRDTSYLDLQVVETIDAIRMYINSKARARFKTWKLSHTEENFGAGAKVMNPSVWRSFLVETYSEDFIKGTQWCQDLESYKKSIIVDVKKGSKTRLEWQHRPDLIGQFYIGAGLTQFV